MRAPPEADTTTSGRRRWRARSALRAIASPTTEPIEPPMKPYSSTARIAGMPSIWPSTTCTASASPIFF